MVGKQNQPSKKVLMHEMIAATVASFFVSPTNAIFDKSVIELANGKYSLRTGLENGFKQLIFSPFQFFTSFKFNMMFFVYTATYGASNLSDHYKISEYISDPVQKLLVTFAANSSTGILKDKLYIQKFGVVNPKPFPKISLGLFFTRDIMAILSAFILPPIVGKQFEKHFGWSERQGVNNAQIICPLLIQIFSTPLHLLGIDFYNREGHSFAQRLKHIKSFYLKTLGIRMVRFLPAYGIGGVINLEIRRYYKKIDGQN